MEYTEEQLQRLLDNAKTGVFLGKSAAFLSPLMCTLPFRWDPKHPTAWTDGLSINFSPKYFTGLPPKSRETELMHELWHVARLHMVRIGSRKPYLWNIACDIKIDLDLEAMGYTFEGIQGVLTFKTLDINKYRRPYVDDKGNTVEWIEESIYDDLNKTVKGNPPPPPPGYVPHLQPGAGNNGTPQQTQAQQLQMVTNVIRAIHQAKMSGQAGTVPGDIELVISKFLKPIIPWEKYLHDWMTDLLDSRYTFKRPNRRYSDIYIPTCEEDDGRLKHLLYVEDVSGSITDKDALRFNSEFKYVKDKYNPKKMTLVQFDTRITQVLEYTENDRFDQVKIIGRGGTDLECVRQFINKTQPTAAVIFSDLECLPMGPLTMPIPILWVCINNRTATVPYGKMIHIK